MLDNPVAPAHTNKIRLIGGDKMAAISRNMVAIPVTILIASKCILFLLYASAPLSIRTFIIRYLLMLLDL